MSNGQTRITVDVAAGATPLSRFIFGHFIEHIRDCVEVLWAEKVRNRDFALLEPNGLPPEWEIVEGEAKAGVKRGARDGLPYGVEIRAAGGKAILRQKGIPLSRGEGYKFRMRFAAEGDVRELSVELLDEDAGRLAAVSVPTDAGEFESIMLATEGSPNACLQISFSGGGGLTVDCVSLMPISAVDGIPVPVLEMIRGLSPSIIRYPGGCFADTYHWEDGIGSVDERPNRENVHWKGLEPNDFGTDEFVALCRNVAAQPLICVNFGTGAPEEAATWVEYCNGAKESKWGSLRAENGHPEPYSISFWEVGNEIYGEWEKGHCSAEEYAERYIEFYKAMKSADQDIRVMAVGHVEEGWNEKVLSRIKGQVDFLTMHFYHRPPEGADGEERFRYMMAGAVKYEGIIRRTEALVERICGGKDVGIAITEWNTMYRHADEQLGYPREHTIEAALFNAGMLNAFMRNTSVVRVCNFSDLINGWAGGCIRVGRIVARAPSEEGATAYGADWEMVFGTPSYHVLKVYSNHALDAVLPLSVDSPCFDAREIKDVPYVDAVATVSSEGDRLNIFMVNRDMDGEREITLELKGFQPSERAEVLTIAGDSPDAANTVTNPDAIIPIETRLSARGDKLTYRLPPCSLTVFLLRSA